MAYMAAMTLPQLRQLVRDILHEYELGQGAFWKDTTLENFINVAYRYYMLQVELINPGTFVQSLTPISVVSGTDTYALSSDSFLLWAIWWSVATYDKVVVWESNWFRKFEHVESATPYFLNKPDYVPSVRVRGTSIILRPAPTAAFANAIIPEVVAFPVILTGSGAVDAALHPVLHPLIALRAAYLSLSEDGNNPQNFQGLSDTLMGAERSAVTLLTGSTHPRLEQQTQSQTAAAGNPPGLGVKRG